MDLGAVGESQSGRICILGAVCDICAQYTTIHYTKCLIKEELELYTAQKTKLESQNILINLLYLIYDENMGLCGFILLFYTNCN